MGKIPIKQRGWRWIQHFHQQDDSIQQASKEQEENAKVKRCDPNIKKKILLSKEDLRTVLIARNFIFLTCGVVALGALAIILERSLDVQVTHGKGIFPDITVIVNPVKKNDSDY